LVTILNANGENRKVIQELMRHANLKVTMDTYVQAVTDESERRRTKPSRFSATADFGRLATPGQWS
jgi:integrase